MEESFVVLREVKDDDIQKLRVIRNECKNYMTRSNEEISEEQQQVWWSNLDKSKNIVYLLHKIVNGVICFEIGYGILKIENDCVLLTGGIVESERGKGHGISLFRYLTQNAKSFNLPVRLELLKTNTQAFLVYNSLGFRVIGDDGKIITMEYHYDSVI